jgi:Flp pilus assembly protein TadD
VHLAPHDAGLHHSLGLVLLQYGNLLGARLRLQQAIRLEPRSVEAWFHLGLCCQQQGDLESALVCFRRVSELRPDHPEAPAHVQRLTGLLAQRGDAA